MQQHTDSCGFARIQAVAFAKKYGVHVLRWVNPVRNCDDKRYPVETIEALLPGAVQYFVLGAPANIIQNHNPVATGIVNGTRVLMHSLVWHNGYQWTPPVDSKPGQIHDVPRPGYLVVVRSTDGNVKSTFPQDKTRVQELIPLQLEPGEDHVQGVKLLYKAFPLDMGFAITYHKVQGQTMRQVILFLHERKTRQLAKLQWESLYVAMTRVKCGNDLRVCYRGSHAQTSCIRGLQHLTKLKRPELYDTWQAAYDKFGYWDDRELKKQAAKARHILRKTLSKVTCLSRTSVSKLKKWCGVLDLHVGTKAGTTRRNKIQYLEALTPIWVACKAGTLQPDGTLKPKDSKDPPATKGNASLTKCKRQQYRDNNPLNKLGRRSHNFTKDKSHKTNCDRCSVPPPSRLSRMEARHSQTELAQVRKYRTFIQVQHRMLSSLSMATRIYARNVTGVGNLLLRDFYQLAVKGLYVNDTVLRFMLQNSCPSAHVPSYLTDMRFTPRGFFDEQSTNFDENKNTAMTWVQRIEAGSVLMLPYNWPVNHHWVAVFAWKEDGKYHVQSRNSMYSMYSRYRGDVRILKHAQKFISQVYTFSKHSPLPNWNHQTAIVDRPSFVTEQGRNECAFNIVANGILAQTDRCFTHTFNNDFVDNVRNRHILLAADYRQRTMCRHVVYSSEMDRQNVNRTFICNRKNRVRPMFVRSRYFKQIENDDKFIEARPDYPSYRKYSVGDIIPFKERRSGKMCLKYILAMRTYEEVRSMLLTETVKACLPHLDEGDIDLAVEEYHNLPNFKVNVQRYEGVRAFELGPLTNDTHAQPSF